MGQEMTAMMPTTLPDAQSTLEHAVRPAGLYRVSEAALMVGLHDETIRRRIRAGKVRAWGSPHKVALDDLMPRYEPTHRKK
jgi:hypothetical protein